jgi:hypothetical protein
LAGTLNSAAALSIFSSGTSTAKSRLLGCNLVDGLGRLSWFRILGSAATIDRKVSTFNRLKNG